MVGTKWAVLGLPAMERDGSMSYDDKPHFSELIWEGDEKIWPCLRAKRLGRRKTSHRGGQESEVEGKPEYIRKTRTAEAVGFGAPWSQGR